MLATMIIFILSFIWLGFETDWLTIRLPYGAQAPAIEYERISWSDCVTRYGAQQVSFIGVTEPLCGWDWLRSNTHPVPEYKVQFSGKGVCYNMTIKDASIIKPVVQAQHVSPYKMPRLHFSRNKYGGLKAPLPAKAH